jgi:AcrR family transcriptional regulator
MARKPRAKSERSEAKAERAHPKPARIGTDRGKIIEAFMELLAEERYEDIGLGEVAARAGVSLATLRGEFSSTLEILAAQIKEIDREVLAGSGEDMAEEPPRERLFDVLMRRCEALTPYKDSVRSLLRSAQTDPCLALALNALAVRSMQWMLTAADINAAGPIGLIRAQGLAVLYARVLQTFVDDDEPGNARTLAALDRALARGQRWVDALDGLCRFVPGSFSRRRSRHMRHDEEGEEPVAI